MANVSLPKRPNAERNFERLATHEGNVIAMKFVGMKKVKTVHGTTNALVCDVIVHNVGYFPEQLCFWTIVKQQILEAKPNWVIGLLDSDQTQTGRPFLLDGEQVSEEQKADIIAMIREYDADSDDENDDDTLFPEDIPF